MSVTAPKIRRIPMARLRVKGSPKAISPTSTAVTGSIAPMIEVAVEPTYFTE